MRPITRRSTAVRMPKPCEWCMGDVYMVDGVTSCASCRKQPAKALAAAISEAIQHPSAAWPDECPVCGESCTAGEGVEHEALR